MNMNKKEIIEMEVIMREITDTKEKVEKTIKYWQSVLDELDRRAMEYSKIYESMKEAEEEENRIRDSVDINIGLNLRGKVFDTTKDILVKDSTYFSLLFSSSSFELDAFGELFIDRNSHRFDRILEYMMTGVLSTEELNSYDKDCLYGNLIYFMIPHEPRLNYSRSSPIVNLKLAVFLQLKDGRLCGRNTLNSIVVCNMDTNILETTLEGHNSFVFIVIQLEDGRICSCSRDKTIKVWSVWSGQCELTMIGHTSYVYCVIQLVDGRLCSGSEDISVKIWNKDSGVCELTITTDSYITCIVQLRDGRLCSGDGSGKMKIWNITTGVCELTLDGHTKVICAIIAIDELRVFSCSSDKSIKIWNVSTGVCERGLEGHTSPVYDMVLLLDGRLCSVSGGGSAKIWNKETNSLFRIVQLHDGRLLASSSSYVVYIIG
jgi:WD40 repeat protein